MNKFNNIEKQVEKKYRQKDKRKQPKMHQSGKGVFQLQILKAKPHDSLSKRENTKKK